jgi:peptidoglycan/LPS O-acetylase OafA/YrhL
MKNYSIFKFRGDIQGLRAFSIISVVLFHLEISFFKFGYLGVDIFFVISGFVISKILFLELQKNFTINFFNFYIRRFKRLFPALAFCVIVVGILSAIFISPLKDVSLNSLLTGVSSLYGFSNIIIGIKTGDYFDPQAKYNIFLHTWSLSVEEQFYIFFSIFFYFSIKKKLLNSFFLFVSIFFLVSLFIFFLNSNDLVTSKYTSILSGFYSPASRAWEFLTGVLSFIFVKKFFYKFSNIYSNILVLVGFILIACSFFLINNFFFQTLACVFGAGSFLIGGSFKSTNKNFLIKVIRAKYLCYVGSISYSWYLWHWPVIIFFSMFFKLNTTNVFFVFLISLIPSILSYEFLENPIRKLKNFNKKKLIITTFLTLIIPTIILLILIFANSKGYWSDKIVNFKKSLEPLHIANISGCGQGFVPNHFSDKKCLWNSPNNKAVYLIGDSNADQFSESVIIAGKKLNSEIRVFTKGGCSFIGRYWSVYSSFFNSDCNKYVDNSIEFLKKSKPGIVFIGISDSVWRAIYNKNIAIGPNQNQAYKDPHLIEQYLLEDLIFKIKEIKLSGHEIILIQPVPKFIDKENKALFDFQKYSTLHFFMNKNQIKATSISSNSVDEIQSKAKNYIKIASIRTESTILDLKNYFCDEFKCLNVKNNFYMYRDATHISVEQSVILSDIFKKEIEKLFISKE